MGSRIRDVVKLPAGYRQFIKAIQEMSVIYALIPVAIIFVIIAIAAFFWAVRSNQFEDIERQGLNILMDDDKPKDADNKAPSDQANKEQESDNDAKR